jgi:signal transduction histidine kinase
MELGLDMNRKPFSLKAAITLSLLAIGLVIIIGYSFLSYHFFFRGMDNIVSANMERALNYYLDDRSPELYESYSITTSWESQPNEVKMFHDYPSKEGKLYIYKDTPLFLLPNKIVFLIKLTRQDQPYYISLSGPRKARDHSSLVDTNHRESWQLLLGISISIALILILIIWLFLKKVSAPVAKLGRWTHQLDANNLDAPVPDFDYSELNNMAELIRTSLQTVHKTLEREQQFLKFTSHELRTPISVIRNNIELANKLHALEKTDPEKQTAILTRIDRASHTMQHLTETLLWLTKEDSSELPSETCQLNSLIDTINGELQYLLSNKKVTVSLTLSEFDIKLPVAAARIVITNIIRNAFQHTWEGHVHISQFKNEVVIINHCLSYRDSNDTNDLGFGLGLRLTHELCEKLGWYYENNTEAKGHHVIVRF